MMKRIISAFLVPVLLAVLALPIFADGAEEKKAATTPLPSFFDSKTLLLADFDTTYGSFTSNDAAIPMYITSDPNRGGTASLEISVYYQNAWRGIMQNFDTPADFFLYTQFAFSVYVAPSYEKGATYTARALFRSESEEREYTADLLDGRWYDLVFDISDLDFRHEITNIEISVMRTDSDETVRALSVDDVLFKGHLNEKMLTRYEAKAFTSYGTEFDYDADDGHFALVVNAPSPTLEFDILTRNKKSNNAAVFYVDLPEECTNITLYFADENNDFSTERSSVQKARHGAHEYVFAFPNDVDPTSLKLVFEGVSSGRIEFYSASLICVYENEHETFGSINSAQISSDKKEISIKGSVGYDTAIKYKNSRLELFVLESYEDGVEGKESVASIPMTARFEFHIDMPEDFSPEHKYAVCIIDADTPVYIDEPKYISNCHLLAPPSNSASPSSKKGMQTDDPYTACELGVSHAVIDLYLDELTTDKSTGYLHTSDGAYYYYDMEKVNALDAEISCYYNVGTAVYIRLLVRDTLGRDAALFCKGETDTMRLGAAVDFLSSRYNDASHGKIAGFVVGRKVDTAASQNYAGKKTLGEYISEYARTLVLVHNVAKANNSACRVIAPVSSNFVLHDYSYESRLGKAYDKKLFISGLCDALENAPGTDWSLMLECDEFFTEEREDILCASNYYLLDEFLSECKGKYTETPDGVILFFTPEKGVDSDTFSAMLAYSYYTAALEESISVFILNTSDGELIRANEDLIKHLDTDRSTEFTASLPSYFGATTWAELVASFNEDKVAQKHFVSGTLSAPKRGEYSGDVSLWNFSTANSSLGWKKGSSCLSLLHVKTSETAFLDAVFEGSCGSVLYAYGTPASYESIDAIGLDVELSGNCPSAKLTVIIKGDRFVFEKSATLTRGERVTLFCSTDDLPENAKVKYIEIRVSGNQEGAELKLYRVSAHSKKLDSSALESALGRGNENDGEKPFNSMWIVIISTVIISSITAAALIAKKERE